jgi:large subunit ribosomal protein L25
MSSVLKFNCDVKETHGTGVSRATRREGRIPGIIYGKGMENIALSVSDKEFSKEYYKGHISSQLLQLTIGGKEMLAVVKKVQLHPVSDHPLHIDFLKVNENETIKTRVPLHIINEDVCPGIKKGGALNFMHHFIEVECKPTAIPASINLDVGELEIGQSIHVEDIALPKGVTLAEKTNHSAVALTGRSKDEEGTASTGTDS